MSKARVTVVVANHNYGRFLPHALTSIREDDYPNKMVVVVDDGSSDGSQEVARKFMSDGQQWVSEDGQLAGVQGYLVGTTVPFRLICLSNANGPSVARNIGIASAAKDTDIFAILDADDVYRQGKISKSVARIMESPSEIGAVYTDYDTVNNDKVKTRVLKEPFDYNRLCQECIVHSACVINKKAFETVGSYDPELRTCEDYDLWLRISEKFMILHIPEALMTVRVGTHDSTHTVDKETWGRNWQRVMQKLQQRRNG